LKSASRPLGQVAVDFHRRRRKQKGEIKKQNSVLISSSLAAANVYHQRTHL
jgi:hypothetical protein